jgi:MFS transporter, DHA3 family, macrolide efflux protein
VLMLKALRHRSIARLWLGQAFSSIGDEFYRVSLIWLVVGLIGKETGYLAAAQAAALMLLSFIGGKWADNWRPLNTMVGVDLIRAVIVLIPVAYSFFAPLSLPLLVVTALLLSGLGAFFDPALQTCLPHFSPDLQTLRSATGLMSTTTRLARFIGPGLIGVLGGFVPPIHFFTLDAFTFAVSAASVRTLCNEEKKKSLKKRTDNENQTADVRRKRISFAEAIASGFHAVRKQDGMTYLFFSRSLTSGTWNLAVGLGFALLVQKLAGNSTSTFGMVIAGYGGGNLAGALFFGNRQRSKPLMLMFTGFLWLGLGFTLISMAPTIPWIVAACAFTGFAGPMNDLAFVDLIQARFPINEMTKVFRLRLAIETASTLLFMLMSPTLVTWFGVRGVIAMCGIAWMSSGVIGFILFKKKMPAYSPAR